MKWQILAGYIGLLLFQLSTWLQLIKTLRMKRVDQISFLFWVCIWTGCWGYMIYAVHIKATVYIISNALGLVSSSVYLVLYLYYRNWTRFQRRERK